MNIRSTLTAVAVAMAAALLTGCAAPAGQEHIVEVKGMTFEPAELEIAPGDTVTWVIEDAGRPHDVVAYDGSFQSGLMEEGEFSHTFTDAGVYDYFCTPHPGMEGVITVE